MHADIGIGIILSIILTQIFGMEFNYVYLIFGIIFALLPDIDLIPGFKKIFEGHRGYTHRPLLYLPIAITIFLIGGPFWALLFALGVFFHLVHDTLWIGNGIAWFWPRSQKRYKFFNQERPFTPGPITWMRDFYSRPTIVSVTETCIFLISLGILSFYI